MDTLFPDGVDRPLRVILGKHFESVKFDAALAKRIYNFQLRFINLTEDHLNFFGSNLLGVHVVHFTDREVRRFFDDVLDVNLDVIKNDIGLCPDINPEFKISSDTFNLVLMYVIHRMLVEQSLSKDAKWTGTYNCALLFFYRCVAALISDWFTWPTDPAVAQAAFAALDKKYLIKKLGSWSAVMDYRARRLLDAKEGIHLKALTRFDDDLAIVYCINDSQGAIRSMMKFYYAKFDEVHSGGNKIASTGQTMVDAEGDEVVKDRTKGVDSLVAVFKRVVADEKSFVRPDLVQVVRSINKNTSVPTLEGVLKWMSYNYTQPQSGVLVDDFCTKVISYSAWLVATKVRPVNSRDYAYILDKLKHLYLSTRIEDAGLQEIRDAGDEIIKRAFDGRSAHKSLLMSTRTAVILYVTLRSMVSSK